MIPDGAIGLLIGFMIGSISGVFCFALIVGAGRYEDGEYTVLSWRAKMKKAITIYVDDCVESIEEVNATFVLRKPTGTTSVHMFNLNLKDIDTLYLPWKGDVVVRKEGDGNDQN